MGAIHCVGRSCCSQKRIRTPWWKPSRSLHYPPVGGRLSPKHIFHSRRNNVASSMKEGCMQIWRPTLFFFIGLMGLILLPTLDSLADEQGDKGSVVEGAGFSLFDMESIKGSDTERVERDPICDRSKRPKIHKVEPDEAKPGQKVTIKGENFGTKECFHGVAFSAAGPAKIDYKFVNDTTIEATVPDVKAGMSFIDVVAGGGNARSKGFLVQAK